MRRIAAVMMMLAAPVIAPLAAQHPDFSGKWTLDAAASGPEASGVTATVTITQTSTSIKLEQSVNSPQMGQQSTTLTFALDGSTSKNSISAGGMALDLTSTAAWEGSTLVVKSTADVKGQQLMTNEHWSLDSTGKVLTLTNDIMVAGQTMSRKQVFNKA